ncbi:MAG TPA: flagellar basal body-associated FliL family protein [Anaerolineales bacterium]|nr:flagellar basal body-associated FliL family protein [Anaerolineales bacterium]
MKKIMPILKTVGMVLQNVMLVTVFAMNGLMGYIMFAPDDMPKPFYLSYAGQIPTVASDLGGELTVGETDSTHTTTTDSHGTTSEGPTIIKIYEPGQGQMVDTGTKVVNLADPGGRRFLKATITIEVPPLDFFFEAHVTEGEDAAAASHSTETTTTEDPRIAEFNTLIENKMPIINDILNTLLTSKTFDQIYTVEGKEALREEIKKEINARLPELGVIAVYFTEFVVQ